MAGFIPVMNNAEIDQMAARERPLAVESNRPLFDDTLARYVRQCFDEAKRAKDQEMTGRLLDCARRRRGEYDPIKLAEIRAMGGSELFVMLTDIKCRAAESWISDILLPAGDRPWTLAPTPMPEIDPELAMMVTQVVNQEMQAVAATGAMIHPQAFLARANELFDHLQGQKKHLANMAAERMAQLIEDQLVEGKWRSAFEEFLTDFCTFPVAFMKGPYRRRERALTWNQPGLQQQQGGGGGMPFSVQHKLMWTYSRVSPYDLYFDPGLNDLNRGYMIERAQYTKIDLMAMKGVPGYFTQAIDQVIAEFGRTGLREWLYSDMERARLEDKPLSFISPTSTIEALEFAGPVLGSDLLRHGFQAAGVEPGEMYEAAITAIGPFVIRATLNEDPLLRRLYHGASFVKTPGSIYGKGIPESMSDVQDLCNGAGRSLHNNMAIASGPQVVMKVDRLPAGEKVTKLYPWKQWQMSSQRAGGGASDPAIEFFQPESNAAELLQVFEFWSKKADEVTGIPNYTYGSTQVSGAGRTMGGLGMLMGAASKGIKRSIFNIDIGIVEPTIERQFFQNMVDPQVDPQLKRGDLKPKARGATELIVKEIMAEKRNELLAATNNPVDLAIIGLPGRAEMLRESVKSTGMDVDRVVPTREQVMENMAVQAAQAQAQAEAEPQDDEEEEITLEKDGNGKTVGAKVKRRRKPKAGGGPKQIEGPAK